MIYRLIECFTIWYFVNRLIFYFLLGMYENQNKLISSYSNGMKQKVAILVAFLSRASVLILNQPTENIDPLSRQDIYTMLSYIQLFGKPIIIRTNQ